MTKPQAHLEITSGIIRLYSSGSFTEKSPFDFALSMVGDGDCATLKGFQSDRGFTREHHRAIADCLRRHGYRFAAWDRFKTIDDQLVLVRGGIEIR